MHGATQLLRFKAIPCPSLRLIILLSLSGCGAETPSTDVVDQTIRKFATHELRGLAEITEVRKPEGVIDATGAYMADFSMDITTRGCVALAPESPGSRGLARLQTYRNECPAKAGESANASDSQRVYGPGYKLTISGTAAFVKLESGWQPQAMTFVAPKE
jgi:hypothetical protein